MDAEFAKMPATVGGAMTQVKNAAMLAIGQLDKATGSSKALAGALQTIANNAPIVAAGLGAITAAILAAASAWAVYRGAALLAAGATALLAGASSIATLVSLAGAVKSVGDAFAFASLAFPYLRIAVAIVAALTAGYAIYKRIKGEATGTAGAVSTTAPGTKPPPKELTDHEKTYRALVATRSEELGKLTALNRAYGQSDTALKLLEIQYDAAIQRAKDKKEYQGRELATLNALTAGIARQRAEAVLLADAEDRRIRLRNTQRGAFEQTREARQALELAALGGASEGVQARARIEMEAQNALLKARLDFAEKTEKASAAQVVTAQKEFEAIAKQVEETRKLALATSLVEQMNQRVAAARRAVAGGVEQALTDVFNRRNPLPGLVASVKSAVIRGLADALSAKIVNVVLPKFGIEVASDKQVKAAKEMVDASKRQYDAALIMSGKDPKYGDKGGTDKKSDSAWGRALEKAKGVVTAGVGGYGVGYGVGQSTGSGVLGAISGGIAGAKMGAAFGPAGIAVGALAGVAGGLLGAADAAREAKARLEAARKAFRDLSATLDAEFRGDPLASERVRVTQQYDELRQAYLAQITVAEALGGALRDVNGAFADIAKREAARLALAEAAYKAQVADTIGGYRERELRAMGKDKEAGELGRQNERARLIASFGAETDDNEKLILAALDAAQAAERNTKATEANTAALTRVLNAPTGYKVEADIYRFATPAARPRPGFSPSSPFTPPQTPLTGTPQLSRGSTAVNVTFNIDGTKTTRDQVKQIATELKKVVTETLGSNADIAEGWGLLA
jgi:hypothetical protein